MKKLMINCEKASFLISMQEEKKLTFWERTHLKMHLAMCRFCSAFAKQTLFITKKSKRLGSVTEWSNEDKNKLKEMLKKNI